MFSQPPGSVALVNFYVTSRVRIDPIHARGKSLHEQLVSFEGLALTPSIPKPETPGQAPGTLQVLTSLRGKPNRPTGMLAAVPRRNHESSTSFPVYRSSCHAASTHKKQVRAGRSHVVLLRPDGSAAAYGTQTALHSLSCLFAGGTPEALSPEIPKQKSLSWYVCVLCV